MYKGVKYTDIQNNANGIASFGIHVPNMLKHLTLQPFLRLTSINLIHT
jgi:hypothetical protein